MNEKARSDLRAQAAWYRKLAGAVYGARTRSILQQSAEQLEQKAEAQDGVQGPLGS